VTRRRFLHGTVALTAIALGSQRVLAEERAQNVARLGFVHPSSPSTANGVTAFWERLRELGYVERQNLVVETRWAEGQTDRLPALMTEVIGRKVDIIVTFGTPAAVAAKDATRAIPIVDAAMADPVRSGLVTNLARPEGNLTGLSTVEDKGMAGKWLELLQEMVPRLSTVALIANPKTPITGDLVKDLNAVAPGRNLKLRLMEVREAGALSRVFQQMDGKVQGALVLPDSMLGVHRREIVTLAAKHRLPVIYSFRYYVDAGGLISYGPDLAAQWRRAADYVDKILRGARPDELPIEQPTHLELVVNLKVATALGLAIPESILLRADEVIR